jgi:acetyl-CoA carboxylase carboxyl transferase subunit alpha
LLDTPGAYPGLEAEERGQAEAIARNLLEMARLPVPIVVAVIGEGASGGALGIGVGDRILMLENAWYSVISPESCSSILWRSWDYKEDAAQALKLTAEDLIKENVIDEIVREPVGGAHQRSGIAAASEPCARRISAVLAELEIRASGSSCWNDALRSSMAWVRFRD